MIAGLALLIVLYFQSSVPTDNQSSVQPTSQSNQNEASHPPKTHLRSELERIVNELHPALYAGDATTVDRILSDEFVWYRTTGGTLKKRKVIELTAEASPEVLSSTVTNFELISETPTSAIVNYIETLTYKNGGVIRDNVTANFVKREEQWQIASLKFYK